MNAGRPLAVILLLGHFSLWALLLAAPAVEYSIYVGGDAVVQQQSSPYIEILGAWDKTSLQVYLHPSGVDALDTAARDGVEVWYAAIREFTFRYGYAYIASLTYTIAGSPSEADITVRYVSTLEENACGVARYSYRFTTGALQYVRIEISRECVGTDDGLAFKVVAHEYGHALGLGHSSHSRDLMYDYVNSADRPSTLNLYALAVAYQWVSGGSFHVPRESSVGLPRDMPYEYIAGFGQRHLVRVLMDTGVGGKVVLAEEVVEHGSPFRYAVDANLSFQNNTEFRFRGWFRDGRLINPNPQLLLTVNSDLVVVAMYEPFYRAVIHLAGGEVLDEWVRRGDLLTFSAPLTISVGPGVRLAFVGWSDGVNDSTRVVEITGPIAVEAIWKSQYYLDVESDYGLINGVGWWDAGTWATLVAESSIIELSEGVRVRLAGLVGDGVSVETVSDGVYRVLVSSPARLEAEWVKEYLVRALATHGPAVLFEGWVSENSSVQVNAIKVVGWTNGTRAVFLGWEGADGSDPTLNLIIRGPISVKALYKPYYLVRVVSELPLNSVGGWVGRGGNFTLDAGDLTRPQPDGGRYRFVGWDGDVRDDKPILTLAVVEKPLTIRALWVHEYPVTVETPETTMVEWVGEDMQFQYTATPTIYEASDRRLVFREWVGDTKSVNGATATVYVDGPKHLKPIYSREFLISLVFTPIRGSGEVEATAHLSYPDGSIILRSGEKYWVPEGQYRVDAVLMRNVDVRALDWIHVSAAGDYEVPVNVFNLRLRAVDLLGLPFANAYLEVVGPAGIEATAILDGGGASYVEHLTWTAGKAIVRSWPFTYEAPINVGAETNTIILPLSPYGLLTLLTASAILASIFKARKLAQPSRRGRPAL